jgi:hypothetical protein
MMIFFVVVSVCGTAPNTSPNVNLLQLPRRITVMRIGCSIAQDTKKKKKDRQLKDSIKQN